MIRFRIGRACIPNRTIVYLETDGRIWRCLATPPCVAIQTLFDYLKGGETLEEFLTGFPTVSRESAVAALEEAKELLLSRP